MSPGAPLPAAPDLLVQLERQTRVNRALFEVSQRLAAINEPDDVPPTLAVAVREATGASYAFVGVWYPDERRVDFVGIEGVDRVMRERISRYRFSPDRFRMVRGGVEGRANVRLAPFDPDDLPVHITDALGITAIAGAPVVVDGETWGIVAVATRPDDPDIVESGVDLLSGLTAIAASAIGRAQAVAALGRQAELLETLVDERTGQLRKAVEEAREASSAKSTLLANVSHELRTPLTAILGFSQVLRSGFEGELNEAQLADVSAIEEGGRRLLALIDDLLMVSRIETGRIAARPERVEVRPLLGDIVEEFRARALEHGLELGLVTDPSVPAVAWIDPHHLREIVGSLVGNALTYTREGGRIDITARVEAREAVDPAAGNGALAAVSSPARVLVVDVLDTGIGIAAADHEVIFERFTRVAGPAYPGTGLGLPIARELARLQGGDVGVESEPGHGSRFTLRLPIDRRRPAVGATAHR